MDVILGGKFENALIHGFDEINRPDRNRTSHQYYIGLNRSVDRSFFDRASTFLVVSSRVLVPTADWSSDPSGDAPGIRGASLDVSIAKTNFNEWDKEVKSFADFLVKNEILSLPSREFVAHVKISDIPIKDYDEFRRKLPKLKHFVSVHYICRLILQLRAAQSLGCYLVRKRKPISALR